MNKYLRSVLSLGLSVGLLLLVVKYPWILVLLTIALIIVFVAYVFHEVLETLFG